LVLHGQIGVLVDVELEDGDLVGVLGLDLVEHGRDHATRPAPRGPEVDQHGSVGLQNVLLPGGLSGCLGSHGLSPCSVSIWSNVRWPVSVPATAQSGGGVRSQPTMISAATAAGSSTEASSRSAMKCS